MTFKEKLAQEHPEKVDEKCEDVCIGCPHDYGYADKSICNKFNYCDECWGSEMPDTPAPMTAEEAWELAKKLFADFSDTELNEIYGKGWSYPKLMELSPQEAKAKIEEWESKQIQVGDVVSHQGLKGVVTRTEQGFVQVLTSIGTAPHYDDAAIKRLVKTGKHIDIQSVLDQIGGGKHD